MGNKSEQIKLIGLLPLTVVVIIPLIFLYLTHYEYSTPSANEIFLGIMLFLAGLFFSIWSAMLFFKYGEGTPAPWKPTQKLVIKGPYCYSRNPMISGILMILAAESAILNSTAIFLWLILFFIINVFYLHFFEEKGLIKRFGKEYQEYKDNVPMWFPRLSRWQQPKQTDENQE